MIHTLSKNCQLIWERKIPYKVNVLPIIFSRLHKEPENTNEEDELVPGMFVNESLKKTVKDYKQL